MNGLMNWLEKYIVPVAAKIGSQKHLVALRDAFIGTLPATMAGSIALLLNAFLRDFPTQFGWTGFVEFMQPVVAINGLVWTGTLAVMALLFAFTLGYNVAKAYKVDPLSGGVVSLASFLLGLTTTAQSTITAVGVSLSDMSDKVVEAITTAGGTVAATADGAGVAISGNAGGVFLHGQLGGAGLFTAIIFGFISSIIFSKLMLRKITIKLPDAVPPAVSKAFAAIIPALVSIYVVAILNHVFTAATGDQPIIWIAEQIQAPLLKMSQGFGAVILVVFLVHLLWFFGIHGTNVMAPVFQTIWGTAMVENANAAASGLKGADLPFKWVAGTFDAFVWPGGAGGTLMLVLAVIILSKRADQKAVGKLALAPGLFNINEPVMFGMPIVLNAIYMIPFIVAPCVMAGITYLAVTLGIVAPVAYNVIWVMPPVISGFLATGGDFMAIVLTLVNLAAAFLIWAPFVLAANKIDPNAGEVEE